MSLEPSSALNLQTRLPDGNESETGPPFSRFEFWSPWFFYVPVAVWWLWLSIRHRSFTLPTAANPSVYSGGLIMETKSTILDLVAAEQRRWLAPHIKFPRPPGPLNFAYIDDILRVAAEVGIVPPLVVKPDIGQRGAGVRLVRNAAQLLDYLQAFPANVDFILQHFADFPLEAGILYVRRPDAARGQIFSITLKTFPCVIGDGRSTLRQLIEADARASRISHIYFRHHAARLDEVIPAGQSFALVFAGNHCQGAVFSNGSHLLTPGLADRMESIAQAIPDLYFGRFDLRFASEDALRAGKDFLIVEINGAGAEATHIWDAREKLFDAWRTLFRQFSVLFEIGAANRRRGALPLALRRLLADCRAYRRLASRYPTENQSVQNNEIVGID